MNLYPGLGKHWWEHVTPADIVRIAQATEKLGYDYVTVSEHIVMDRMSLPELGPRWVHSNAATGFLLGATERIRIVPHLVVPYHNPIELAKALSTLDYLSGGRVIPLCMVGYNQSEFKLMNVPYADRGLIMDEYLDAMIELWENDNPSFHGIHVNFDDIVFDPKPVQRPLPLWFGGRTKAALRRIARVGDGWISYATPRSQFRELVDYIRGQPAFQERPRPLELGIEMFEGKREPVSHKVIEQAQIVFEDDAILEQIQIIADLGATLTDASDLLGIGKYQNDLPGAPPPSRSASHHLERLHWFAEAIMPQARRISRSTVD